tara:strand:+ start:3574 stop:5283 length:1710 start_codon:yes stop_codon:yes gene_type:complete
MTDNLPIQPKGYKITKFNLITKDDSNPDQKVDQIEPLGEHSLVDFRKLCSGFNYIESIDSPSVRMEIAMFDTIDLISSMTGNEFIQITIETDSAPGVELEIMQRIFKIGEITKSERAQLYVIYTVSPETINNETNKVFKSFKDDIGSAHVDWCVKEKLKSSGKNYSYEPSKGNFRFLAPTWRPYDCIGYISDKIVSSVTNTAGYLFFENRDGYYFHTIDWLCSDRNPTAANPAKYTYEQANVGESDFNAYKIESMNFPDRANHLEKMRSGTYSNTVLGLKLPAITSGNLPASGDGDSSLVDTASVKDASRLVELDGYMETMLQYQDNWDDDDKKRYAEYEAEVKEIDARSEAAAATTTTTTTSGNTTTTTTSSSTYVQGKLNAGLVSSSDTKGLKTNTTVKAHGASGSIQPPLHMGLNNVFGMANKAGGILNDQFPFPKVKPIYFDEKRPTRTKIRALPGMKNAQNQQDSTGGAGNMDFDTIWASAYSFSRWQLLKAITLDITIPGNVALAVGQQLECVIPASTKEEERTVLDPVYSGRYLITGLTHKYNPEGVTTLLNLSKDSITTPT